MKKASLLVNADNLLNIWNLENQPNGMRNVNNVLVLQNETRRVYDGMDVLQERDQYNNVNASYTRTGNIGGILARTTSAGSVFYGYDGGGNVVALTNNSGAQVGSYTYDAFGNTTATSGTAASENPYRFSLTLLQLSSNETHSSAFARPRRGCLFGPFARAGGRRTDRNRSGANRASD